MIPWAYLPRRRRWRESIQVLRAVPEVREWAHSVTALQVKRRALMALAILVSIWWIPLAILAESLSWFCQHVASKLGFDQLNDRASEIWRDELPATMRRRPIEASEIVRRTQERFPSYTPPPRSGHAPDQ